MTRFTKWFDFEHVSGTGRTYIATSPTYWEVGRKGSGWKLTIPTGYTFDISVPWFLKWILSPHDRRFLPVAAVHDILLEHGHDVGFASSELRRAAVAKGYSRFFAWSVFFATLVVTAYKRMGSEA